LDVTVRGGTIEEDDPGIVDLNFDTMGTRRTFRLFFFSFDVDCQTSIFVQCGNGIHIMESTSKVGSAGKMHIKNSGQLGNIFQQSFPDSRWQFLEGMFSWSKQSKWTSCFKGLIKTGNDQTIVQSAKVGGFGDDVISGENWKMKDNFVDDLDNSIAGSQITVLFADASSLDDVAGVVGGSVSVCIISQSPVGLGQKSLVGLIIDKIFNVERSLGSVVFEELTQTIFMSEEIKTDFKGKSLEGGIVRDKDGDVWGVFEGIGNSSEMRSTDKDGCSVLFGDLKNILRPSIVGRSEVL